MHQLARRAALSAAVLGFALACNSGEGSEHAGGAGESARAGASGSSGAGASTSGVSGVSASGAAGSAATAGAAQAGAGGDTAASGGTPSGSSGSGTSGSSAGATLGGGAGMSAGAGGAGGAGAGGGGAGDGFTLAWQDDFDTLDTSRWALQTFSWDGNLAQFSTENASVANGILSIALTPEPSDTAKPYRGVELRSIPTVTYGKVEARLRFAKGSGVISALVLIYTPWPADDWNEIDIEHLGKTSDTAQLNCQVYTGAPTTPPVTQSVSPTQDPLIAPLGFDAEGDFHLYTVEWTPVEVRFKADGALLRTWTTQIARMKLPQNILFTIWASGAADWAGPITAESAPTTADIDWIKVYSYAG